MYSYEQIRHVHLEPTTRCNASCPMCARNTRGVTAPGLRLSELGLTDVRAIFPEAFLAQTTGFDLCGAYGDPALASQLVEIVAYVRSASPRCMITVYSNGGVQTQAWWERLAAALGEPARVVFAIDGIGETNAIYRRGVKFEKVMDNARAFIAAGGAARWEFLAFRHNEHEIESARELSREMGFEQFSVKKTDRFLQPTYEYVPEYREHQDLERFPVFDGKGAVVSYLEPPKNPDLVNKTTLNRRDLLERFGTLDALFAATAIQCRVLNTSSVFVSAQGYVFPCCWTYVQATRPSLCEFPETADRQIQQLVEATGGFDRIDARRVGLAAAVDSPLFRAIEAGFSCGASANRLKVCARACGNDFPAYFDQFSDVQLQPRSLRVLQSA
jgi:MoaA/NifB/PqqE/SkfB family radical SAM enzyme